MKSSHGDGAYHALLALFAVLFSAFVALTVWQVERRAWKHALIERVETRAHAPPADAPQLSQAVDAADDEYRHVVLRGAFLPGHETFVRAVTVFGSGYWTLTPLRRDDGSVVLVNRGFVTGDQRAALPAVDAGQRLVTGLLRMAESDGSFVARNDAAADRWVSRDVAAIAAKRGLAQVAPWFVDADADPDGIEAAAARGGPVGGLTVVTFTDNHLLYAITWSTLAAMCAGAAIYLVRRRRRERDLPIT